MPDSITLLVNNVNPIKGWKVPSRTADPFVQWGQAVAIRSTLCSFSVASLWEVESQLFVVLLCLCLPWWCHASAAFSGCYTEKAEQAQWV